MEKRFSLRPILQIREHTERMKLQEFLEASKEDRALASRQALLRGEKEAALAKYEARVRASAYAGASAGSSSGSLSPSLSGARAASYRAGFEDMRDLHNFFAFCEREDKALQHRRDALKPQVDAAKERYIDARKDAEALRIAAENHRKNYEKYKTKKFFEELQEKSIWQKTLSE